MASGSVIQVNHRGKCSRCDADGEHLHIVCDDHNALDCEQCWPGNRPIQADTFELISRVQ